MRKQFLLYIIFILSFRSYGQIQIGLFGGLSNYQGDLVDKPYKSSKGVFGGTLSYALTNRFVLRGGLTLAKIAGADSLSDRQSLKLRNLSFQSDIKEISLVCEFYTFDLNYKKWSPYIFAGLAVFHFNPYTYDQKNNIVYLRPLSTEGQGLKNYPKAYSSNQLAIPFGGGIKFVISDNVRIGLEVGLRKTFTDYLDDVSGNYADAADLLAARGQRAVSLAYRGDEVTGGSLIYPAKGSQRGNPKSKDYYYFTGLHLTFNLFTGDNSGLRGKSGYGCPANPL